MIAKFQALRKNKKNGLKECSLLYHWIGKFPYFRHIPKYCYHVSLTFTPMPPSNTDELLKKTKTISGHKGLLTMEKSATDFPHYRSDAAMSDLEATYTIGEFIGQYYNLIRGAFGVVNLVENKETGQKFACKTIKKRLGATSAYEQQEREVNIMKIIRHENILLLHAVYESPSKVALIME